MNTEPEIPIAETGTGYFFTYLCHLFFAEDVLIM